MLLRDYQETCVQAIVNAVKGHGNTVAVAPTGAGKTIMLAETGKRLRTKTRNKILVLQHRDELVDQNMRKWLLVNPDDLCAVYNASSKCFGDVTFAMVQSLYRHIEDMPKFDIVIIDEAHHTPAETYRKIIDSAKEKNPKLQLVGFTATPTRSDAKSMVKYYNNIGHQIRIAELVSKGYLVPPRVFVSKVSDDVTAQLQSLGKQPDFGEQSNVANILNTVPNNDIVVDKWLEMCGKEQRPTVVFCSTIEHAKAVCESFERRGISAGHINGDMNASAKAEMLNKMTSGDIKIITNVMVLTEGWDYPPVSCVILLRKCSAKTPIIQMIGRGLRIVNEQEYPGIVKKDCIVLDFGLSLLRWGDIDADEDLDEEDVKLAKQNGCATKVCPSCGVEVPIQTRVCPFCEHVWEGRAATLAKYADLTEIDILNKSSFHFEDIFNSGRVLMASGFEKVWSCVCSPDDENWYTFIGNGNKVDLSFTGGKPQAIAVADDYMRNSLNREAKKALRKSKTWLTDNATEKQINVLNTYCGCNYTVNPMGYSGLTKYSAMGLTNFLFNVSKIEKKMKTFANKTLSIGG